MWNAGLDGLQAGVKISGEYQSKVCGWYHANGRKQKGTKDSFDEGEEGGLKANLKLNIKNKNKNLR